MKQDRTKRPSHLSFGAKPFLICLLMRTRKHFRYFRPACLVVLNDRVRRLEGDDVVYRPAITDLWRVPDALMRIRTTLESTAEGGGLSQFLPSIPVDDRYRPLKARAAVASTFVAGLELAKAGHVDMMQKEAFGPLLLRAAAADGEQMAYR